MHQVRPAAVAAASVFAFLVARALVSGVLTTIYWAGFPYSEGGMSPEALPGVWLDGLIDLLGTALPLSVGAFLVFWRFLPVKAGLRVTQVVGRGVVAVLAGAVLAGLVGIAVRLWNWLATPAAVAGGLYDLTPIAPRPLDVILSVVTLSVSALPLVVLAAVLLWLWLQRNRPTASVSGVGDEV
jgi:hypothetical protein